ncbi:serine hydrolase domain-containing protein [Nocardia sp. NPDC127526]|uniref:serine hydrolase domain-containing protein n=1 Tax=Nocardia sp. NPDC127526 TaxID=3345393 RepID=UPI003640B265
MKRQLIGLIAGIGLFAGPFVTPIAHATPTTELTPASIDAYLDRAMASTGLPGLSVVVTRGSEIVHAAGYGHDSNGDALTANSPMRVASLSKSFTAMAVLRLVDDGRVALDAPVAHQLPEFRMADPRASSITVRQLLNQTSGLSDSTVDIGATETAASLREYVSVLGDGTLAAAPGAEWRYCNANYNVAARLVEVASGLGFGEYMRQRIFDPLGMTSSAVSDEKVTPARGFNSIFGVWVARPELPGFLDDSGSGGVITTAADMGHWLISQNGKGTQLVAPRSLEVVHSPQGDHDYGMGWGAERLHGADLLLHSGNLFTYNAVQAIDPGTGYGFAVMANSAALHDDTYDILSGLVAMSRGVTPEIPGGDRQLFELALALLAAVASVLGILGVWRSRRWASRRAGRARWRIGIRLLPGLLPLSILAAYPQLITVLVNGRTVTWAQLTYFAAPMTITLVIAAAAGAATAAARAVRLASVGSKA